LEKGPDLFLDNSQNNISQAHHEKDKKGFRHHEIGMNEEKSVGDVKEACPVSRGGSIDLAGDQENGYDGERESEDRNEMAGKFYIS